MLIFSRDYRLTNAFEDAKIICAGPKSERLSVETMKPRASPSITRQPLEKVKIGSANRACTTSSPSPKHETTTISNDNGEDQKPSVSLSGPERRKTYRVKNRAAAKRCREKTKQYELGLATKEQEVIQERIHLDECVTALRNEILSLKGQILQHGDCDCDVIQGYIARAAGGVGAGTTTYLTANELAIHESKGFSFVSSPGVTG
ncbi:hypothetical protein COL154_013402 [Colletotrichum chrysophilum]|nr:hypothetical protein KNSL1_012959 [Colletotrichum chrysophilum]KAJ0350018.1 hypothetical protein COL154_013402 [Colletotrichum chrysophilum]